MYGELENWLISGRIKDRPDLCKATVANLQREDDLEVGETDLLCACGLSESPSGTENNPHEGFDKTVLLVVLGGFQAHFSLIVVALKGIQET